MVTIHAPSELNRINVRCDFFRSMVGEKRYLRSDHMNAFIVRTYVLRQGKY